MAWDYDPSRPMGHRYSYREDPLSDPIDVLPTSEIPAVGSAHALSDAQAGELQQDQIIQVTADLSRELDDLTMRAIRMRAELLAIVQDAVARLEAIPAP